MHKPLKSLLEDPTAGNEIQALAARHARLFLHTNIWQRPSSWLRSFKECPYWYAQCMYCRLLRRYHLQTLLPHEADPMWLQDAPARTADGHLETEHEWRTRILYITSFGQELVSYSSKYLLSHAAQWNNRLIAEQEDPVGKKVCAHGTCFAYICVSCEHTVLISRLFETQTITRAQATLEHAYCYGCYQGLDGSKANFDAYRVHPKDPGQIVPSAFSLLEVGLACEALTQPPTVARVLGQLLQDSQSWSKGSVQAALHMIFPDTFEPAFVE